ncbi:serine hydrolase domain-containing protein [Streptomyces sp. NPDC051018]|uniref:serine hydrolase domain-containing protein n=1 Tax=Streptomyces sp. NPDC051018 TaxID=3365639 RepID=UPI00378B7848
MSPRRPDPAMLKELLDETAQDMGVAGAQLAMAVGDDTAECATGLANARTRQPVTTNTIFQVGSTTKLFTAALILQLVDEGLLGLDTPVSRRLPDIPLSSSPEAADITPRLLMSMTSGLDNGPYRDTGRGDDAIARYAGLLGRIPLISPPGERYGYSNASTVVSGLLVERLTGVTWDRALRSRLLAPLALHRAATLPEDQIYHSVAVGHDTGTGPARLRRPWIIGRGMGPAGTTLCAAAGDLMRFGQVLMSGGQASGGPRALTRESAAVLHTRTADVPAKWFADSWCVGPYHKTWDGTDVYGHSGTNIGGSSLLLWVPEHEAVIAVTMNVPSKGYEFTDRLLGRLFPDVLGVGKPTRPVPDGSLPVDTALYTGSYDCYGFTYEVTAADGRLFLTRNAKNGDNFEQRDDLPSLTTELKPIGDHRFLPGDDEMTTHHTWDIAFVFNGAEQASGLMNGAFGTRRAER